MKILSVILLVTIAIGAKGQNVLSANVEWKVNGLNDLIANSQTIYACIFQTNDTTSIDWQQGIRSYKFHVKSTSGKWQNATEDGTITYVISLEEIPGILTIERTAGNCFIMLDLASGTADHIWHKYKVETVSPIE